MASGDKKYGRNKKDASRYQLENRLSRNKRKTAERHVKRMTKKAARRVVWQLKQDRKRAFSAARAAA